MPYSPNVALNKEERKIENRRIQAESLQVMRDDYVKPLVSAIDSYLLRERPDDAKQITIDLYEKFSDIRYSDLAYQKAALKIVEHIYMQAGWKEVNFTWDQGDRERGASFKVVLKV